MSGSIRLGSKRGNSAGKPRAGESIVHIDRTNPILGNRHVLRNHRDPVERAAVIEAYEADLLADEQVHGPMTRAIERLADRVVAGERMILLCWCHPEYSPCHGQFIVERIQRQVAIEASE